MRFNLDHGAIGDARMKPGILDFESDLVSDQLAPHLCQLFEIEYCKVSGEVAAVWAISTNGNGRIKEWDFLDLPPKDQAAIQSRISKLIFARQLENGNANEL